VVLLLFPPQFMFALCFIACSKTVAVMMSNFLKGHLTEESGTVVCFLV